MADTGPIVEAAVLGLRLIYEPSYDLAKAGVMLLELCDSSVLQGNSILKTREGGVAAN